ncbi:MAG: glycosyltransferase family 4 protein, partial [Patescibacteria group bacterium]|nr:glycosyltransferase family 4 protein [Patescibacteria group bacterium]
ISIDHAIFIEGSPVRARMEHFGALVDGIDIISLGASEGNSVLKLANGVTVHPIASNSKIAAGWTAIRMAKKLARENTVVVSQDPFELGLIGVVASWLTRRPLNVQVHIDFFNPYFRQESLRQRFQALIAPISLFRAASIRAVSGKIATYLRDSLDISASKITIAPIFVDMQKVQTMPTSVDLHALYPQYDWIVLVAARYVRQKNIRLAIEAFELFRESHPKAGLVIAGRGREEQAIRDMIVDRSLERSVQLGSWSDQFVSCMRTSDVFVMSSDYEGWGMTVVEAAACGKPIIMTDVGCAGEFIVSEKNGLVVPPRDPAALSAALEHYYVNRAFALNMGKAALRDASTYMTVDENDQLALASWQHAIEAASSSS